MSGHSRPQKPQILAQHVLARSRLFAIEEMQLRFSNGVERTYERLAGGGRGAVMMVAMPDPEHVILIREYAGGVHDYCLSLPKGLVDAGEDIYQAANRELKEEVGMGAGKLEFLTELTLAPNYIGHKMSVLIAQDLYPCQLEGDEPEPLIVETHPLAALETLILHDTLQEARAIAALYMTRTRLQQDTL